MAESGVGPQAVRLVLASASPRRKLLMEQIGLRFEVAPADVDEQAIFDRVQASLASRGFSDQAVLALTARQVCAVAAAKAEAVAQALSLREAQPARCLVIGADTVVVVDGQVLGKPASAADAERMLALLAGRTHQVLTGVAVLDPATRHTVTGVETSEVTFSALSTASIEAYVRTGEPMDKAGAYAVQGLGSIFIKGVEGCYFNVVGLPLSLLAGLLRQQGFDVVATW